MFAVDYSTGFDRVGQGAGEFAQGFTEQVNKKALVDAEKARTDAMVARAEVETERSKRELAQSKLRDIAAQKLAGISAGWTGEGFQQNLAGVDAQGKPNPLDTVARQKLRTLQETAKNIPADMLPEFLAVREQAMEEEILTGQREAMQNRLADMAGRLSRSPMGEVYQGEIEQALMALDGPGGDPRQAEEVLNRLQGVVEQEAKSQIEYEAAEATVGGMIETVKAEGGDVAPYAEIYGQLVSGALTAEEARQETIRRRHNLGPELWTVPGTGHKMEVRTDLLRGRGRDVSEMSQAAAAEAWNMGAAMARQDPSLGEMPTSDAVFELADRYAMQIVRSGGWTFPSQSRWDGMPQEQAPDSGPSSKAPGLTKFPGGQETAGAFPSEKAPDSGPSMQAPALTKHPTDAGAPKVPFAKVKEAMAAEQPTADPKADAIALARDIAAQAKAQGWTKEQARQKLREALEAKGIK